MALGILYGIQYGSCVCTFAYVQMGACARAAVYL